MKDIFTINIENKEYVHIDTIKYKNQMIYHFGSLEDEIFCIKNSEQYIPIIDSFQISAINNKLGYIRKNYIYNKQGKRHEIIKKIKNGAEVKLRKANNLIRYMVTDAEKISQEQRDILVNEQIDNFRNAKEKYNLDIDMDKIQEKIKKIKVIRSNNIKTLGYYKPVGNILCFDIDGINKQR